MSREAWLTHRGVEGAALALLSAAVVLSWIRGWDDPLTMGINAVGFLLLGLTTSSESFRWLCFSGGVLLLVSIASNVLSGSSPLESMPILVEVVLGLALLIVVPALLIREHVAPASDDFRAIERADNDAGRRERMQRSGGRID